MLDALLEALSPQSFMPHGHCYLWTPGLVWLQVLTNVAIGLAYFAITATLLILVRRIRDLPFQWMYLAFAVFIVTCGVTHFMDVLVIWHPAYWVDGGVRALTAVASVATALLLPPLVPKAVALADAAVVSHQRGMKLEEANRELAHLLDRSRELDRLKSEFFANVSHELRTPLALILGPAEQLLSHGNLTPSQARDLDVIARNARTLMRHVEDLLDTARLDAGRLAPRYARLDLARMLRTLAGNFDGVARDRGMHFEVAVPDVLPAEVDEDQLSRVVLNLLSNAFKFTPAGGRVRLSAHDDGKGRLHLEVRDSGPGIRPEDREVVFERFRQLDGSATRQHGGTGLGLAIARDFVRLHGGTIHVGSAPEGGAAFVVEMPLKAPEGAAVETPAQPVATLAATQAVEQLQVTPEAAPVTSDADLPRVLVVEDNRDLRQFLADALAPHYRVTTAADGAEGLRVALESPPDLIITDAMMPVMGGEALLREVRSRVELDQVPVVMLTAKVDEAFRTSMLKLGAQDYLPKPFSVEELRVRVDNQVGRKRARDALEAETQMQGRSLDALVKELARRQRELQTALETVRVAREHAERASQVKTEFLALVSHELRTPLGALVLQVYRLSRDAAQLGEKHAVTIRRMEASTKRLQVLIESLLEHSRIEAGRIRVSPERVDPRELVAEVVDDVRPHADEKGLTLVVNTAEAQPITTDARLLRLILGNLLTNAVKFTVRGSVEVDARTVGDTLRVAVKDTGPGIHPDDQVRVFEPFVQLEPALRKHTPGVGLGLALVREMAEALGGSVELTSELGVGSTFVANIPALVALPVGGPQQSQDDRR
ncbi:MAG: ATP-binding protein [Myxococcota bacterium]